MKDRQAVRHSINRVTSIFSSKGRKKEVDIAVCKRQKYMRLNFLILAALLKKTKSSRKESRRHKFSFFPFITTKILNSGHSHFIEITKQATVCCIRQDLYLFPFRQFFLRNEFTMRQVIEWRLSKYMKSKEQLKSFVEIMKQTPPDTLRRHLVTLINQGKTEIESSNLEIKKIEKEQEAKWDLWKHHADGDTFRVSRA